ncbi:transposase [Clostridium botulinum]|uniref:transposase n=1 Tax=Clostridium botulinum TaxID=1491 RepID=UPI00095795D8|nr:transposase [Clostridium botulinum]APU59231.1 transposase family protein [Clostridium botulinum]APU59764.1 transposase family protein [Clostridium botulinum]APU60534.1 transposase family protein [Clostridium botulinum]
MKSKQRNYSKEIKMKAVKMYLEDGMGSTRIAKELGLSSYKRVLLWAKNYQEFGEDWLEERRGKDSTVHKGRPNKKTKSIEEENLRLKAENEYLKKLLLVGG